MISREFKGVKSFKATQTLKQQIKTPLVLLSKSAAENL